MTSHGNKILFCPQHAFFQRSNTSNRKWFQVNHDRVQPCGKRRQSSGNPGRFVTSLSLLSIQDGGQRTDHIVEAYTCWLNYKNSLQKSLKKQRGTKYQQKTLLLMTAFRIYWMFSIVAGSVVECSHRSSPLAGLYEQCLITPFHNLFSKFSGLQLLWLILSVTFLFKLIC